MTNMQALTSINHRRYLTAKHELKKANKGLRRLAGKNRHLKKIIREQDRFIFECHLAMSYMATGRKIEPYEFRLNDETWHPAIKSFIDMYEDKKEDHEGQRCGEAETWNPASR